MSEFRPLRIAVAGPYTAATAALRKSNLDKMNQVAAQLLAAGHIPLIGVNAALPVVDQTGMLDPQDGLPSAERRAAIMEISMGLIEACEAILMIGESPGANRERDRIAAKGLPVYTSIEQVPRSK